MSDEARKWLEWYDKQQSKVDINLSCKIPSKHLHRLLAENEKIREIIRNATVESAGEFIIISLTQDEYTALKVKGEGDE